jgi:hypothetical protein
LQAWCLGENAEVLKPIGDIFLNLLFVAVIPLGVLRHRFGNCQPAGNAETQPHYVAS